MLKPTQDEKNKPNEDPLFEPFPVPNTLPSSWDVSELVKDPKPVSSPELEHPSQTENK